MSLEIQALCPQIHQSGLMGDFSGCPVSISFIFPCEVFEIRQSKNPQSFVPVIPPVACTSFGQFCHVCVSVCCGFVHIAQSFLFPMNISVSFSYLETLPCFDSKAIQVIIDGLWKSIPVTYKVSSGNQKMQIFQ